MSGDPRPPHQRHKWVDAARERLVYEGEDPTPQFWDRTWGADDDAALRRGVRSSSHPYLARWLAHRLLPHRGDLIVEAGCGLAGHVWRLHEYGYRVMGIDNATATVARVNRAFPELDVRVGDVRALPLRDATVGLMLSFGVLEHFVDGPGEALREAYRVLQPGGRIYVTVPYFSPLRRIKARFGAYGNGPRADFFQYAYGRRALAKALVDAGFRRLDAKATSGYFGLWEECSSLSPVLDRLGQSTWPVARVVRAGIGLAVAPVAGHMLAMWGERPGG